MSLVRDDNRWLQDLVPDTWLRHQEVPGSTPGLIRPTVSPKVKGLFGLISVQIKKMHFSSTFHLLRRAFKYLTF